MAFISVNNLQEFKTKLDGVVGYKLSQTGATINLLNKSGATLSSVTIDAPTYADATQSTAGLMSATDKTKLDGVAIGATVVSSSTNGKISINGLSTTVYAHPTFTAQEKALYKTQIDGNGHVIAVTAVTKSDITALGIPGKDTTYSAATTSAAGLMSAADKTKLSAIDAGAQVNAIDSIKMNGAALPVSGKSVNIDLSAYALKSDVSQAVTYKGSVSNYSDLPTTGNKTGDLWNVVNSDAAHGITAGENVVWDGSEWDALGSIFSVIEATNEQIDALFA